MGEEINPGDFSPADFAEFKARLRQETDLLRSWFDSERFTAPQEQAGFELEAWLVDDQMNPAPRNGEMIQTLDSSLVVPELSRFNFEINSTPQVIGRQVLSDFFNELNSTWAQCQQAAGKAHIAPMLAGILPTVRNDMLSMENVSDLHRYRALNREVLRLRDGKPLHICIEGSSCRLEVDHHDVMAEAATTSLQVHLQCTPARAASMYNATQACAAPLVAACANSPYLFETDLWQETRIPLFEQAVALPPWHDFHGNPVQRVSMGSGYVGESLMELFEENVSCVPVLLPTLFDEPPEALCHLRLHNGTIWRWNRPLVGIDNQTAHLRIEARAIAAGPSLIDVIANIGMLTGMVKAIEPDFAEGKQPMSFADAQRNFYAAARDGLDAELRWYGQNTPVRKLLLDTLLPAARNALVKLSLDSGDIERFFDEVIVRRVESGQTGACWQRAFIKAHGPDFQALTRASLAFQDRGVPGHEWSI